VIRRDALLSGPQRQAPHAVARGIAPRDEHVRRLVALGMGRDERGRLVLTDMGRQLLDRDR